MMYVKMINKKAISPMIATVLMVAFAIVLAILVWFWYSGVMDDYTNKPGLTGQQSCAQEVDFTLGSATMVGTDISFEIENKGSVDINKFKVIITGDSLVTVDTSTGVLQASTIPLSVPFDSSAIGTPTKIEVMPIIVIQGQVSICDENMEISSVS